MLIGLALLNARWLWCLVGCGLCTLVSAKDITVVAGWNKPPYIITEGAQGFEMELAATILSRMGHHMKPVFVPFGRSARQLENGVGDMVLTVSDQHNVAQHLLSDIYVEYQNAAVTLASRNLIISKPTDLRRYTVLAFQTARDVLGPEFSQAITGHQGYVEIAAQDRQVKMLLLGSVDVAVMDKNIFSWLRGQLAPRFQKDVTFHPLFAKSYYRAAIVDDELRRDFNFQLALIKQDGTYQALLEKYRLAYPSVPAER